LELAIVDCSGRISVFSISTALNVLSLSRSVLSDSDDDGAQVVGLLWLNMNRPVGRPSPTFHDEITQTPRCRWMPFIKQPRRMARGPTIPSAVGRWDHSTLRTSLLLCAWRDHAT